MSDIAQSPFTFSEFTENPEPRCACLLLLDTSGSMGGAPIRELNAGLQAFKEELSQDALAMKGTSKNGPFSDLLSMAPDVSLVRRGLFGAISVFLPPDAQVGA